MNVNKPTSDPDPFPPSLRPSSPATAPKPELPAHEDRWEKSPEINAVEAHLYMDRTTERPVVEFRDAETQEVIREFPNRAIRQLDKAIRDLAEGTVDVRA